VDRLYEAGLGREADLGGFQTWLGDLNGGQSVVTVVSGVLSSSEWQSLYAGISDAQLITSLFDNFLGRVQTAAELSSWTGNLGSGATRGAALAQTLVTSQQSEGYWGLKHPGASDVIFAGAGNDIVNLGTNNAEVYAGAGSLTVVGNANGFSVVGFHGSYADYRMTHNGDDTVTVTNINNTDGDGTVTMKNVTVLDFKDISQIPLASTAGLPVSDELNTGDAARVTVNVSGQCVIAAANDGQGAAGVAYDATVSSMALPATAADGLDILMTWSDYDVVNNSWTLSPAFGDNFLANPNYE
jgi:hypothetical protein